MYLARTKLMGMPGQIPTAAVGSGSGFGVGRRTAPSATSVAVFDGRAAAIKEQPLVSNGPVGCLRKFH